VPARTPIALSVQGDFETGELGLTGASWTIPFKAMSTVVRSHLRCAARKVEPFSIFRGYNQLGVSDCGVQPRCKSPR
jgi:hypothetical protein